jgi:hypothetical protein
MSLYLTEFILPPEAERDAAFDAIDTAAVGAGGELIELQIGPDAGRLYAVVEHRGAAPLESAFEDAALGPFEVVEVRLVGPTLDEVKAARGDAGYLVEWDFPDGLGMDAYLARKKQVAPKYAEVPETTFLRTYVCEDMTKCLCFYRAPDEDAVLRAREAVDTPVSRIGRVKEAPRHVRA